MKNLEEMKMKTRLACGWIPFVFKPILTSVNAELCAFVQEQAENPYHYTVTFFDKKCDVEIVTLENVYFEMYEETLDINDLKCDLVNLMYGLCFPYSFCENIEKYVLNR